MFIYERLKNGINTLTHLICPIKNIECISCTLISLANVPTQTRTSILHAKFISLVNQDCAFIELCLHQLRALVRSILFTPSTFSATLTSPAHTGNFTRDPQTDPRSPTGKVSPCGNDKQAEVDLLIDAGIASALFDVVAAYPRTPFITEFSLNVLRDLALCNTSDRLGRLWILGEKSGLLDLLPNLFHGNSTVQSSTLDLLSAVFGTTSIARNLPMHTLQSLTDSLVDLLNTEVLNHARILHSIQSEPYQATVLGINKEQLDMYSYRWTKMLIDKAVLALCSLVKANYDSGTNLMQISQTESLIQTLTNLVNEIPILPAEYPETDVFTNALITLIILAPHISDPQLPDQIAHVLERTLKISPNQFTVAFDALDQYIPPQLLPKKLLDLVDRPLASYATIVTLMVHLISLLAESNTLPPDCLRVLQNMVTLNHLPSSLVSKSIRRGDKPLFILSIPPPLDKALTYLLHIGGLDLISMKKIISNRYSATHTLAHRALKANALTEAEMWFGVTATYAKALHQPVHALLGFQCDCLLLIPGMEDKALQCALDSLSTCELDQTQTLSAKERVEKARNAKIFSHVSAYTA